VFKETEAWALLVLVVALVGGIDVVVTVFVDMEVEVSVLVIVVVLDPSPSATNRLAEISTPAMTIAKTITR
jgi:hypothetical protein